MSNILEIIVKAVDQASATLNSIGSSGETAANQLKVNWLAVGAALTAAGAGIELLARSQSELSAKTRELADDLGITEKAMRDLVIASADHTMSIAETLDVMELGYQQGLKTEEQLSNFAKFWNDVSTATGESVVELAKAGSALQAVGIDADNLGDAQAALGFIMDETTVSTTEFLTLVGRLAPELNEMGLGINDVAAYIELMESKGISGRVAISQLRSAFNECGGDTDKLNSILGVTSDEFDVMKGRVADAKDEIGKAARIVSESYTPLQKLQSWAAETTYSFGSLIGSLAPLGPALMIIGPAIAMFPILAGAIASVSAVAATGTITIAGMTIAVGTLILPVLAIIAAVVLLYAAWKTNFLGIQDVVANAKVWISDRFEGIKTAFEPVKEALGNAAAKIGESFGKLGTAVDDAFRKLTGGIGIMDVVKAAFQAFGRIIDYVWKLIGDYLVRAINVAVDALTNLVGFVTRVVDWFSKLMDHPVVRWLTSILGAAIDVVAKKFDELLPPIDNVNKAVVDLDGAVTKSADGQKKAVIGSVDAQKQAMDEQIKKYMELGYSAEDAQKMVSLSMGTMAGNVAGSCDQMVGALGGLLRSLDTAARKATATKTEIAGAASQDLSRAVGTGQLSEYDQMNVLQELIDRGDATPAQIAEYNRLLEKNRSAPAGQAGLSTTGSVGTGAGQPGQRVPSVLNPGKYLSTGAKDEGTTKEPEGYWDFFAVQNPDDTWTHTKTWFDLTGRPIHSEVTIFDYSMRKVVKPTVHIVHPVSALAEGGNIQGGGAVIVGDAGPELLNLPAGARVTPLTGGKGVGGNIIDYAELGAVLRENAGIRDVHLHIQNLIGVPDKNSLRPLSRIIKNLLNEEDNRRGSIGPAL